MRTYRWLAPGTWVSKDFFDADYPLSAFAKSVLYRMDPYLDGFVVVNDL